MVEQSLKRIAEEINKRDVQHAGDTYVPTAGSFVPGTLNSFEITAKTSIQAVPDNTDERDYAVTRVRDPHSQPHFKVSYDRGDEFYYDLSRHMYIIQKN